MIYIIKIKNKYEKNQEEEPRCDHTHQKNYIATLEARAADLESKISYLESTNDKYSELVKSKENELTNMSLNVKNVLEAHNRQINELKLSHEYEMRTQMVN